MSIHSCLKKLFVKFRYDAPQPAQQPAQCNAVVLSNLDIELYPNHPSPLVTGKRNDDTGISFVCSTVSTSGAGSVILLFQVGGYITWNLGFRNTQGQFVTERHRIYFSLPMMYKLKMPLMALMAITPWKFKAPYYVAKVAAAVKKLDEIDTLLKKIIKLSLNPCSGVYDFLKSLDAYEKNLNQLLQGIGTNTSDPNFARNMRKLEHRPDDTARFAGSRIA
ncbi:MAG: hypothetical protein WD894_24805 [Pirellulales bacterium]